MFWLNFLGFQIIWLGCVLGAGQGLSYLGPLLLLAWLPVHFYLTDCRKADATLLLIALLIGTMVDTCYQVFGLIQFEGFAVADPMAPLWISALWMNFALTLNHCMRWMHGRYLVGLVFGAIGGPLSYFAGVRMGAAAPVENLFLTYGVIALVWGFVMLAALRSPWIREPLT